MKFHEEGILSKDLRGLLILPNCPQRPAPRCIRDTVQDKNHQHDKPHQQEGQRCVTLRTTQPERVERPWNVKDADHTSRERFRVPEKDANDLSKRQGRDRQVVFPQLQRQDADERACGGGEHERGRHADREVLGKTAEVAGVERGGRRGRGYQERGGVRTDGVEPGSSRIEESRVAPLKIQPQGENREDCEGNQERDEFLNHVR